MLKFDEDSQEIEGENDEEQLSAPLRLLLSDFLPHDLSCPLISFSKLLLFSFVALCCFCYRTCNVL